MRGCGTRFASPFPAVAVPAPASPDADTQPATALHGLLPVAALLIMWQLAATDDSLSFPPPDEWLKAIARLHAEGLLSPAIAQTLGTYALGLDSPSSSARRWVPRSARRAGSIAR